MSFNKESGKSISPSSPTPIATQTLSPRRLLFFARLPTRLGTNSTFRSDWKAMTTACLLHFDGDVASKVRWIGGPHTNAHLNVNKVPATLEPVIETDVFDDVKQILTLGAPAYCNSSASEKNFQEFKNYGNHKSVKENQSVFESTIIKQSKRGLTLVMDRAMINFSLNAQHLTPQGLVDICNPHRKPRPISDCTFRPSPGASAINNWTNKKNRPPLHFAGSFMRFCVWHWNLALSYPDHDRHTGDDDVQCAFPGINIIRNSSPCTAQSATAP